MKALRGVTYKKSGVNIDEADRFLKMIKPMVRSTRREGVFEGFRGFGSPFRLPQGRFKDPVLVSSTDGVGTKLKLVSSRRSYQVVGVDLVAMNVNDILASGAEPLFFLDYLATGKLKPEQFKEVVKGIAEGCRQSGCALIGGETAEMPGVYAKDDFDLAGFAVGIVERQKMVDGSKIRTGDVIIGLASNGLHSNGYSLVRKIFTASYLKKHEDLFMAPTRIYVKPVLELLKKYTVHGMAHITGGSFHDKVARVLPRGVKARIWKSSWPHLKVFKLIEREGKVSEGELFRTLNMGIGFVLIVPASVVGGVQRFLKNRKVSHWRIGEIVRGNGVSIE